jgi:hypothetical protein
MAGDERTVRKIDKTQAVTLSIEDAVSRVRKALAEIGYGEVVVKVEAGKPIWVDKHERERVG